MPKAYETWTVLPHRPIEKLESNLWRVEGDLPGGNGTRVMTLVKLDTGGLVVHNAIALEEEQMKEIEAFGAPEYIIVPNGFHRLDAKVFKQRYPNAKVLCPAAATKKVKQVVEVAGTLDDGPKDPNVKILHLAGTKDHEGVLDVTSGSKRTLVFNDVINNLPKLGGMIGVMLAPTGRVAVPRIFRWFFVKNKQAFTSGIEKLADTPELTRIIMSHGKMLTEKPADALRSALTTL
jgi:hypothetical protein